MKKNWFKFNWKPSAVKVGIDTGTMNHEAWQEYRSQMTTTGGSDFGSILGLNKYTSPQELFYRKLGLYQKSFEYKMPMALGSFMEQTIVDLVKYHDYDDATFAENIDKKRRQHRIVVDKHTLHPAKHPDTHFHLDGLIRYKGMKGTGLFEAKHMNSFVLDMYSEGLPPSYLSQVLIGTHMLELDYGVLAFLTSNHTVSLFIIEKNQELFDKWMVIINEFLDNQNKAKKAIAEAKEINPFVDDSVLYQIVSEFEPPLAAENAEPYRAFMTERAMELELENIVEGGDEEFAKAVEYIALNDEFKAAKAEVEVVKAYFTGRMVEEDAQKMLFDGIGSVTFRKSARTGKPSLRLNLK